MEKTADKQPIINTWAEVSDFYHWLNPVIIHRGAT